MNKKIRILGIFLYFTVAFSFVSCNDYLDVTLLDQLTQDETFSKRVSTEQYLAHVYSYLPREYEYLEEGSAVPRRGGNPAEQPDGRRQRVSADHGEERTGQFQSVHRRRFGNRRLQDCHHA